MTPKFYVQWCEQYYPSGGLSDFSGPFDTLEEANKFNETHHSPYDLGDVLIVVNNVIHYLEDYEQIMNGGSECN